MEASFRKVEYNEEIILLLENYVQQKWPILLWQTHTRHMPVEGVIADFNIKRRTLLLSLGQAAQSIDVKEPLYCHGEEKRMVFKAINVGKESGMLMVEIPADVRLQELRSNQRFEMYSNKNAFIYASISSHYDSKESSFVLKLNDISQTGCSILTHSSNMQYFKVGTTFKVTQLGNDIVNLPFMSTVVHVQPVKNKGTADVQLYRVGMAFEKRLNFFNYYLTKNLDW